MGKGRGTTLTCCDGVLIAFVVLGALSILTVGLLDVYHVLPLSHYKEKECVVHEVTQTISKCLECDDYQNYDGDDDGRSGHREPQPDEDRMGDMDGDRQGERGDDEPPMREELGEDEMEDDQPRGGGGMGGEREGRGETRPEDHDDMEDDDNEGADRVDEEPPVDGKPEDWFGTGGAGRPGRGRKDRQPGECPSVPALLVHVIYDGMKAMLHGDHSSHDVPHSFADCGLDYIYDYHYPHEYPEYWEPNNPIAPAESMDPDDLAETHEPKETREPKERGEPTDPRGPSDFPGQRLPAEPDMDTNGERLDMEDPQMGELGGAMTRPRPEGNDENDDIKQRMSADMHALLQEFQTMDTYDTKFACYVHPKNPEHVFYEAPYHHNRMGRYRNICYPAMVTAVLILVLIIKKVVDAKAAKKVMANNVKTTAPHASEKYIVPNGGVVVPMPPPQDKAAEAGFPEDNTNEKNPTVLGPEVVPGGIRVGSRTVLMEGPVTVSEKEAEALGAATTTPRAMVSDPFPPVEPGYERVESPPPAYNNLSPRY